MVTKPSSLAVLVGWGLDDVGEGGGEETEDGVDDATELVDGDDGGDCIVLVTETGIHSAPFC